MSSINPRIRCLDSGAWHELERAVERFERAWEEGSRPTLDDYLPADETVRSAVVIELAHAELEYRLRAGEPARAEEYLRKYPEMGHDRAAALELIAAEHEIRSSQDSALRIAEYFDRFPEYTPELRARFESGLALTTTQPPAGQTSQAALETSVPDPEPAAKSVSAVPRVRLRAPRDEADPPLLPPAATLPDHAGRCAIIGEIARGGMGAVLKGHDPELGRDLAVKILLDKYEDQPELTRRFLVEAQVSGQLQHPGIVPIYDVGLLLDRRPYFTMKLIRGRTLAALLAERPGAGQDLPRFLKIFEQVCQTLAYAHARGVIHRDLKPMNVMVGAFGEVQVMDWGLAKVLGAAGVAEVSATSATADNEGQTRAGSIVGTPAYMPPEQARGDTAQLDERCDVFGLGAILCEILTGAPPYTSPSRQLIFRQAEQGRLDDAFRRLDGCGADGELLRLAKNCLAVQLEDRPRDAGVVAREVTTYLTGVQERLRSAELDRAAAQAKAEEARAKAAAERRAKRLTLGLAAAVLLTASIGGAAGLWIKKQRDDRAAETDRVAHETKVGVDAALREAGNFRDLALQRTNDPPQWSAALTAVDSAIKRAARLLRSGVADDELRDRVRAARARWEEDENDRRMAQRLETIRTQGIVQNVHLPYKKSDRKELSAAFMAAFQGYGVDFEALEPAVAADRIGQRPAPIRQLLAAHLHEWARLLRVIEGANSARWHKLLAVALKAAPDPFLERLTEATERFDRQALHELAASVDFKSQPPQTLLLLGLALGFAKKGNDPPPAEAVAFLRKAQRQHPTDVWINSYLAMFLFKPGASPQHPREAIRFLTVALASRPDSPHLHYTLGCVLGYCDQHDEAIVELQRAIELNPKDAESHFLLALSFEAKGSFDQAIAQYQKTIDLEKDYFMAYASLGILQCDRKRDYDAAITSFRRAIVLNDADGLVHMNLGVALYHKGLFIESLEETKRAHERLRPDDPEREKTAAQIQVSIPLAELDRKVRAIRMGGALPADATEQVRLAEFCFRDKKFYATAAELSAQAFAAKPELADNLKSPRRYQAACAAALAGCGQGNDAASLDNRQRVRWRQQALQWLRADLAFWTMHLEGSTAQARVALRQVLQRWQRDPNLAGLREPAALAKLPEAEQEAFRKLWADVEALLQKTRKPN
jgi:serine/threonine-protein kinase